MKHLILKGNNITIPLCGDTTIGKIVVFSTKYSTCEYCKEMLEALRQVESYNEAVTLCVMPQENLKEHKVVKGKEVESILGTKDEFWKNIQKFSS